MITQDGLSDQLLGIVVAQERPDLEEEKNSLIVQSADNKKKLSQTEDKILAEETELKIDEARAAYKPMANNTAILFFAISSLSTIEPMYQYSLAWFIQLFIQARLCHLCAACGTRAVFVCCVTVANQSVFVFDAMHAAVCATLACDAW